MYIKSNSVVVKNKFENAVPKITCITSFPFKDTALYSLRRDKLRHHSVRRRGGSDTFDGYITANIIFLFV